MSSDARLSVIAMVYLQYVHSGHRSVYICTGRVNVRLVLCQLSLSHKVSPIVVQVI